VLGKHLISKNKIKFWFLVFKLFQNQRTIYYLKTLTELAIFMKEMAKSHQLFDICLENLRIVHF